MMLLFRALNEFDILTDPINNGLASKKLLYDLTKSYYDVNPTKEYNKLNIKEKDLYIKEHITEYIKTHNHKLEKIFLRKTNDIRNTINDLTYYNFSEKNINPYYNLVKCISTLNNHLVNGSKTYTEWISTSKNLEKVFKYYNEQNIHSIALLYTNSGGVFGDDNIAVDLSLKNNKDFKEVFLSKKITNEELKSYVKEYGVDISTLKKFKEDIFQETNSNFMGYNFSLYDEEVCIYKYLPKKNIISILETLQVDLLLLKFFNIDFFKLSKVEQKESFNKLKDQILKTIVKLEDPFLLHVYEEIYLNNKNINTLYSKIERGKVNKERMKILKIAKKCNNPQIKR